MRWYLKDAPCGERVTRSTRSWSVHWDRISWNSLNLASELVVRLIFEGLEGLVCWLHVLGSTNALGS